MKIESILSQLNIAHQSEGHKHCREGWINMPCPYCTGNEGLHLGFNIEDGYFKCWRCGWHPIVETLHKISGRPIPEIKDLIKQYGGKSYKSSAKQAPVKIHAFKLPSDYHSELLPGHILYLEKRGFDPEKIRRTWNIGSCGPMGQIDDIEYSNRILIPIEWDRKIVSFQARTISKKEPKYRDCPKNRELIFHKHILYGRQDMWKQDIIVVEGAMDAWRFGTNSVGLFGVEFKLKQVKWLIQRFRRIFICMDPDEAGKRAANKLYHLIQGSRNAEAIIVKLKDVDPGDMPQAEADYLVKSLIK